jgi:hypothetical protein
MNRTTEPLTFTVPLSFEAHSLAEQHRRQHTQPQKAKQVYLNTLAMYAVDSYCRCMGFETEWETSDSHSPLMQKFIDVADLNVKRLGKLVGKLECRPVLPDAEVLEVPPEAWDDRIGYVAVQLNQSLKQAILLGFAPSVAHQQGIIPLGELRSLADFPAYLSQFSQVREEFPALSQQRQLSPQLVNLHNWLEGIFEAGWQTIDELFIAREVSLAPEFRGRIFKSRHKTQEELIEIVQTTEDEETRWQAAELLWELSPNNPASGVRRVADLGIQLAGHGVALMVAVLPKLDRSMAILLRVYSMGSQLHLPPGLQLSGLDEAGSSFFEVQAREQDNYIQLKFTADPGDRFSVRVALDDTSIIESFVI